MDVKSKAVPALSSVSYEELERIPFSSRFNQKVHALLTSYFPRTYPLSVLLLHVSQVEHTLHQASLTAQHRYYHAPPEFMHQLLANVRRVIRSDDEILVDQDTEAALILPDVDQLGAYGLLERVYNSVSLLQAETIVPPLTRETHVVIGYSSYPQQGATLEKLLDHASIKARQLILRPAINSQALVVNPSDSLPSRKEKKVRQKSHDIEHKKSTSAPFMDLPESVAAPLRAILPLHLARELRCIPVGRYHQYLTVAMADPLNNDALSRLATFTGMTIFPVSCTAHDLDALLEKGW
jgi:hypothetical protein